MRPVPERSELGLADFARIIWRRKWSIILLAIVAAAAVFAVDTRRTKVYQGSAQLLVTQTASQALSSLNGAAPSLSGPDVATAAKVISSPTNQRAAAALLKRPTIPPASVSEVGTTSVVTIDVDSPDPALAVAAANAYANAYIDGQRAQSVASLEAAAGQLSTKISALGNQIAAVQKQIDALGGAGSSNPQVAPLQAQQTALVEQQTVLREQVTQLQDSANLAGGGGQLIGPATTATVVSPRRTRDTGLAGGLGLVIGVGVAFLREYADDRIRSEDDIKAALGEVPTIGLVPTVGDWVPRGRHPHGAPHLLEPASAQSKAAAEAYRSVRTAIQFIRLDREIRTLVVTSPFSNEGKSTTVANLAVALAQVGQTVVVVSCDLRRPQLHEAFSVPNEVGFTSVILGETRPIDALRRVSGYDSLWVMPSGPVPPNPSELLASRRTEKLLDLLAGHADMVLIDTPPLLPVTDASVLAARSDATVLVIAANTTTKKQARRAAEILRRVDVNPAG